MPEQEASASVQETATDSIPFTPEKRRLYERRFQEGYDLQDPEYEAWLRITHTTDAGSEPHSDTSLVSRSPKSSCSVKTCSTSSYSVEACSSSSSSDVLHEILVLNQSKQLGSEGKR